MGRKKKVVETQQEKDNNINISGGQKYTGNVSVRLVKNGKTVQNINKHNSGYKPLFDFLIGCLASNYNNGVGIPQYLELGYTYNDNYIKLINNPILKASSFISTNSQHGVPQVNYQFTVPTVLLMEENTAISDNKLTVNTFRLYSSNNIGVENGMSADIILDDNDKIEIPISDLQKYTMFITWSLYISNN